MSFKPWPRKRSTLEQMAIGEAKLPCSWPWPTPGCTCEHSKETLTSGSWMSCLEVFPVCSLYCDYCEFSSKSRPCADSWFCDREGMKRVRVDEGSHAGKRRWQELRLSVGDGRGLPWRCVHVALCLPFVQQVSGSRKMLSDCPGDQHGPTWCA